MDKYQLHQQEFEDMIREALYDQGRIAWIGPSVGSAMKIELCDGSVYEMKIVLVRESAAEEHEAQREWIEQGGSIGKGD
jgi:hypothetical protein